MIDNSYPAASSERGLFVVKYFSVYSVNGVKGREEIKMKGKKETHKDSNSQTG